MPAKKQTKQAKKSPSNPNVIIPPIEDDEPDHWEKTLTEEPVTQNLKDNYQTFPVPTESAGKGRKYCPNCNFTMGARSTTCPNCNWQIVKGDKPNKPASGTRTRTPNTSSQIQQTEKPEIALLRVLKGRGFDVKVTVDALDSKATPEIHLEKSLEKIMEFVPYYNSNGRFEVGLDQLLTMLKLPLNK